MRRYLDEELNDDAAEGFRRWAARIEEEGLLKHLFLTGKPEIYWMPSASFYSEYHGHKYAIVTDDSDVEYISSEIDKWCEEHPNQPVPGDTFVQKFRKPFNAGLYL